MSNAEHLANVMVEAFIAAVERGVDLVPVVADSTSTAKIAPFIKQFPGRAGERRHRRAEHGRHRRRSGAGRKSGCDL